MRHITPENHWPEEWKSSYLYDLQEVFGPVSWLGYVYGYERRRNETVGLVQEVLPKGARILDVAAAQGNFTLLLAELGYDVVWNDLRGDLENYVRLKHECGLVRFCPGNVFDLGFESAFDAVLITEIIEHVAHPDEFLRKIARLVKPGGYVIMTTPNGAHMMNHLPKFSECKDPTLFESIQFQPNGDGHIFLLWPEEVKKLGEAAGLFLEKVALFTTPFANGRHKMESLLRILPKKWVLLVDRVAERLPSVIKRRLMIHSAYRFRAACK